ncbi:MAG: low-specificity L-threonine aldolase [Thermoflexus hugenholtzii]|jgi:threonine aldolase|uniref:low-specificity L-threonine aldolase n=1 Tax=Thermoflexus TaxID=1495649 RepID=UPI001C760343|nr:MULTISPECIES: low-specificity L-threonine aldolase [Thermoflexus]QWK10182.1 MAG: low-specificity L-threonine aldolase [Thermoflexus hugenholtzii]
MLDGWIDLRSDTVTHPTPAMREAMARAEVGDDVFEEDPTVRRLEEVAAERMGKEAALFVASGTMANLVSLLTHCGRGDEVIVGDQAHTFLSEVGGMAALGGIHPRPVPNQPDGTIRLEDIEAAIRTEDVHHPRTRLIALENTHNRCMGAALPPDYLQAVRALADRHGLRVHIDGARIFNAAVALGVPAAELARHADTVTFCLSKGLCAPVGSLICGPAAFIREARRVRKMVGGGMRQAGVLAAAGLVALETMVDRLAEDHRRARRLAEGLAEIPGIRIEAHRVQTNIVIFELDPQLSLSEEAFLAALAERRVRILRWGPRRFRAVTHYWIDDTDIDQALRAIAEVVGQAMRGPHLS